MMLNYSNIQDKIIALLSPINISIVRFFFLTRVMTLGDEKANSNLLHKTDI